MAFGRLYHYREQPRVLDEGQYEVVLKKPFETTVGGYAVVRFPFTVKGEEEPYAPNYFDLFDCLDSTDERQVKMFQNNASKIKECFVLPGAFCEENYEKWTGHIGNVVIQKDKKGFTNVKYFLKSKSLKGMNIDL